MKVSVTFEVDDEVREAIGSEFGYMGMATREQVLGWFRIRGGEAVETMLDWQRRRINAVIASAAAKATADSGAPYPGP